MKKIFLFIPLILIIIILSNADAKAAIKNWVPTSGGSWNTTTNWNPSGVPIAGDDVNINTNQSANITNVPGISLNNLSINGNCTFAASPSTKGQTITVTGTFTVSANKTFSIGTTGLNTNLNFAIGPGGTGMINGICYVYKSNGSALFTNNGSLTISPASYLGGDCSFSLTSGATLKIGSQAGITTSGPTGNIQVTGIRTYNTGANYEYYGSANQVTGNGLSQNTPANLTINNLNGPVALVANTTISGVLTVNAGSSLAMSAYILGTPTSIILGCDATAGSSITGSATLTLGGNITINNLASSPVGATISCPISLGVAARTFAVVNDGIASDDLVIDGIITGSYGITKTGSGSMLLNNVNRYTGTTTINGGMIKLGADGGDMYSPLGTILGTTITNGGLDLNGHTILVLEPLTLNGGSLVNSSEIGATYPGTVDLLSNSNIITSGDIALGQGITGTFDLTKSGAGNLTLTSGESTLSNLNINAGSFAIAALAWLTVSNAITNQGNLNLNSDQYGMFSLKLGSYVNVSPGTVNSQIYMLGGGDPNYKWHYFAVPSQQTTSVLTGTYGDNLMRYDDGTDLVYKKDGWKWSDTFSSLVTTDGYAFYNAADKTLSLNGTSLLNNLGTKPLNYSKFGWNLIGNSLTCGINWDNVVFTPPDAGGDYVDYTVAFIKDYEEYYYIQGGPGVPEGTDGSIPPLQGFFTKALRTGASIDFSGAAGHNSTHYYKKGSSLNDEGKKSLPILRLTIADESCKDETVIWFNEKATMDYDNRFDAEKWVSEGTRPQIYTYLKNNEYVINGIPFPEESIDIPLAFWVPENGSYSINQIQLENVDNYDFYLKDLVENTVIKLNNVKKYAFSASEGTVKNRFIIKIENISTGVEEVAISDKPFNIYSSFGLLNIELLNDTWEGRNGTVKVIDLTGRTLIDSRNVEFRKSSLIQLPVGNIKGIYMVELSSSPLKHTGRVVIR